MTASKTSQLVAIASRRPEAARELASKHGIARAFSDYDAVLEDREIDAVYIPLVNSLHREWSERALQAGKHVLCEKPLAMNASEAEQMAKTARRERRLLMEALMYRFHPRMRQFREATNDARFVHAAFGFQMSEPANYRAQHALGGGALLDVGSYCVNAVRWFLGEPSAVNAGARLAGEVDVAVSAGLEFPGGRSATIWGSFESQERQALLVVDAAGTRTLDLPFTAWRDPDDPYQLMVEAFASSVLSGSAAPLAIEDSIANLRVLDRIRDSSGLGRDTGDRHDLAETGQRS
jgi:predicted dehydrogenase